MEKTGKIFTGIKEKLCLALCLALCLWGGGSMRAQAEEFYGEEGWKVRFTAENKMESNFSSSALTEAVAGLQPGDSIVFALKLENSNANGTDWYMANKVLYSLEDRSANGNTKGGAYTYRLVYTDRNGQENVLFDSDTVGGESVSGAGEGLHEATDALEDYFYLDTLATGQQGSITLTIALDGETQGNDYQDTLADLQMNFAVEVRSGPIPVVDQVPDPSASPDPSEKRDPSTQPPDSPGEQPPASGSRTTVVKTGDERDIMPYLIVMGVSGALFLALAILSLRRGRKEKKGGGAGALGVLLCALLIGTSSTPVSAKEGYTYTVRFYAGTQGTFDGEEAIVFEGMAYGERVTFHQSMVALKDGSKYYIKGIRESGRDNNTVQAVSFLVTGDRDYVVAYGLLGDAVAYTIRYVDEAGRELAPEETYYGNVGDKPVVAFRYIEGYRPQAYNLTKTLSPNAAENIFTFVYTRIPQGGTTTPGGNPGGDSNPGGGTGTAPGGQNPGGGTGTTPGGQTPGGDADSGGGTGTAPGGQNPAGPSGGGTNPGSQGGAAQNPGGADGGTVNPGAGQEGGADADGAPDDGNAGNPGEDSDAGTGPEEEGPVEIEDLDVPQAEYDNEAGDALVEPQAPSGPGAAAIAASAAALLAALALLVFWYVRRRGRKGQDEA